MKKLFLFLCLLAPGIPPLAAPQDHHALRETVVAFVQQQTANSSGAVKFQVEDIDSRLILSACSRLEAFLPAGSQLIGNTSVGVRCAESHGWSVFVPVQIKITQQLWVSSRPVPAGHTMSQEDVTAQTMEVNQSGGYSDPGQILGKVTRYGIAAGQLLREDMLRAPFSVLQGHNVQLVVLSGNFSVRSAGVALSNASEGQYVKVRSETGGVIGGLARTGGVVEVSP